MNICHIAIQIYNVRIRRATPNNKIKTIKIKYIDKDKSKYTHKYQYKNIYEYLPHHCTNL